MQKLLNQVHIYVSELEKVLPTMKQDKIPFAIIGDSDGDACLFNALLATVWGDPNWPCVAVMMSQDTNGMWYRSPRRRACKNEGFGGSFFSRDMATGVMAAATLGGFPFAWWKPWLDYIDGSRPCLVKKPKWLGGGCAVRSPIYYYAPDDRSAVTPSCWSMMGRVSRYRGWERHKEMVKWENSEDLVAVSEATNCKAGYQLHLKVLDAYIKRLISKESETSRQVAAIAFGRVPDNMFYEWMARGKIDTDFVQRYLDLAPPVGYRFGNAWVWEKSSVADEIATTCGWDFVFMGKLILRWANA